jgi:hypothetical protein
MSTPRDPRESTQQRSIWSPVLVVLGSMMTLSVIAYAVVIGDLKAMEPPWIATGVIGIILLGAWLYTEQDNLRRASRSQGARYSATALALIVVALGITVALNVLASRYDQRIDLTKDKLFTISEQTQDILDGLSSPVTVRAFFSTGSMEETEFRAVIEGYEQASDNLVVEFIDPNREPTLAMQYEITASWGTVILEADGQDRRLETEFNEEAITNALVQLTSGVEHLICFSEGHQEMDLEDTYNPVGMGILSERLTALNYQTRAVSLFRQGGVPPECSILVIADPQLDWLQPEHELLAAYVASGGSVLMMLEPSHATPLATDFARYGITVGDDLVLEASPQAQSLNGDYSYVILYPESFDFHPITQPIKGFTIHRLARSVSKGPEVAGINVQELARTTPNSWTKTNLEDLTDASPSETDRRGPIPIIAAAEVMDAEAVVVNPIQPPPGPDGTAVPAFTPEFTREAGARIVVFGDVDFASNAHIAQGNNLDLVMNTIAWMVGEEDQLSIRANEAAEGSISMNLIQGLLIWLICLLIAPGLTLLGALVTWRARRRAR